MRGRGGRVDGHVRASLPSEGGFVSLCAQRLAAVAASRREVAGISKYRRSSGLDATLAAE